VKRAARLGLLALVLGSAAALSAWWLRAPLPAAQPDETSLEQLSVYGVVPAFTLTERTGRPVGRDDLRGSVWVASFVYTQCTDTCPLQSQALAAVQERFREAAGLRLVSITVDPEHDTPPVLRRYAERYGATERWWFLTGDKRTIYCLARDGFHLAVVDPSAAAPACGAARLRLGPAAAWASHGSTGLVMHSDRLVLVDRAGRIRAYHAARDPAALARLAENLRHLLAERA
jgi:cytochrome oxidase Cu insertion factor (SCO1/SenC/PrrC family)